MGIPTPSKNNLYMKFFDDTYTLKKPINMQEIEPASLDRIISLMLSEFKEKRDFLKQFDIKEPYNETYLKNIVSTYVSKYQLYFFEKALNDFLVAFVKRARYMYESLNELKILEEYESILDEDKKYEFYTKHSGVLVCFGLYNKEYEHRNLGKFEK